MHIQILKELSQTHLEKISTWISSTGELPLISAENSNDLSSQVLQSWLHSSEKSAFVFDNDSIIALCTLSINEANFSPHIVEICHCIVDPESRGKGIGKNLLEFVCQEAKKLGYMKVVGRVVPYNIIIQKLLIDLCWHQTKKKFGCQGFIWFEKTL